MGHTLAKHALVSILCLTGLGCAALRPPAQRFGQLATVQPDRVQRYKELHEETWPEVLRQLTKHHFRHYSIYLKELDPGKPYLFGYFEYTGRDFETDVADLLANRTMQEWREVAGAGCLIDWSAEGEGVWWRNLQEVFHFAGDTTAKVERGETRSYGMAIGLRPEMVESYTLLHKYTWPEVLDKIAECHIRNYSIYVAELEGKYFLLSHFDYYGNDFAGDMERLDKDPACIAWTKFTDLGCQLPLATRAEGEWWAVMEKVFYLE